MERPISTAALERVKAALFNGEKIAAIKIYRDDTGASLTDAKNAVDKLEAEWRASEPEKFTVTLKKNRGCGICLVILVVGVALIILLLFAVSSRSH
jgi:ribosomal protein L7/L12